jgi:hypothetical protein
MKTVFTQSEIAHIWAKQSQETGKTPGNRMFFDGKDIFSYGRHFCIARILENGKVLFTNRDYSNTTAKHKHQVRHAISHKEIIYCADPDSGSNRNINAFCADLKAQLEISNAPRKRAQTKADALDRMQSIAVNTDQYLEAIGEDINEIKKYHSEFAILYDFAKNQDKTAFEEREKIRQDEIAAYNIQQAKEMEERKKKAIEDWKKGKPVNLYLADPVYLRVKDEELQTTMGARVSVKAAKILFEMIKAGKDIKGYEIDGYTVIGLMNGTLKIGCHTIERKEINRLAKKLKWGAIPMH